MAKALGIGGIFFLTENYDYGSFGWFVDPAGNRVELWQSPAEPDTNA